MPYTPAQIIDIAKISQYIAATDIANGSLYGARKIPDAARIIYMENAALQWLYGIDPTNSQLQFIANYVYSLLRGYGLEGARITGGGSIAPIATEGYSYVALPFTITADSTSFFNEQLIGGKDLGLITVDNQVFTLAANNYTYNGAPGVIVDGTINFINGTQLFAGSTITFYFNKKY